jgi:hypothetical protein
VAIEAILATVRLLTAKARGCFSARTVQMMFFKLGECTEKMVRLRDYEKLAKIIRGVNFVDSIIEKRIAA